ncbi:DNA repair protein RecO [Streptococcus fryi]
MKRIESRGIVLYNRPFREDDRLVKIMTELAGKRMFFVKHISKSKLTSVVQPLVMADFILNINDAGLSYIDDYHDVTLFKRINSDLFLLSYATYLVALADAAVADQVHDAQLFAFLVRTLELMEDGLDYEVLTFIFEVQILERFGVSLNFHECVICHRVGQAFDFSHRYSGLLCPNHYTEDRYRSNLDPNVPYLMAKFQMMSFDDLGRIALSSEMKQKLRRFIDMIYEDYVGIRLKSKKFIDDLGQWGEIMKS